MRVIAVDPGYDRCGIAVLEKTAGKETVVFSECLESRREAPIPEKLFSISEELRAVIKKYKPEILAAEKLFFTTNQKTAMTVSEVRGVILSEAARAGLKIAEFTPLEVKIAVTGYGRSDKRQMADMVRKLVVIKKMGVLDDEVDAIAVGLTFLATRKFNDARKRR